MAFAFFKFAAVILIAAISTVIETAPAENTELVARQNPGPSAAYLLNGEFKKALAGTWTKSTRRCYQKPNYLHRVKSNGNYVAQFKATQSCKKNTISAIDLTGAIVDVCGDCGGEGRQQYTLKLDYKFPVATTYKWQGKPMVYF